MTLHLDAERILVHDRAEAVREAIASTIVRVAIDFPTPTVFARGAITDFGDLTICSIRSNATMVERTPTFARDTLPPSIFLGLQLEGSSLVIQGGREAVLRPGELVLYDSTAPYTLVDTDGIRQHFFRIPQAGLALPHDAITSVAARTLSPGHPVADLAATYFRRLASRPDIFARPGAEVVSQPSIELVRALITTHLDADDFGRHSTASTLRLRILEYARAHLSDPNLNAAQIAAEHHISIRHLYGTLAAEGISLADWIRTRRLEECRRALARAESATSTVAAVARRWGFADASSFARAFRKAYGLSPREWRDQQVGRVLR